MLPPAASRLQPPAQTLGIPANAYRCVNRTIFLIKVVHTLIFWILSGCVLYALFSGITGELTTWTWVAVGLLLFESVVLVASGWTCHPCRAPRRGARLRDGHLPAEVVCRSDLPDLRQYVRARGRAHHLAHARLGKRLSWMPLPNHVFERSARKLPLRVLSSLRSTAAPQRER